MTGYNSDFLYEEIATKILSLDRRPLLVGIDGFSASGKTYLADKLAQTIKKKEISVLRSGLDSFLNPPETRNSTGSFCPKGYYENCFDYQSLIEHFLLPLKSGNEMIQLIDQKFDLQNDSPKQSTTRISSDTIVVFEGVMLFRPEIDHYFDYKIYVDIGLETSLERGVSRDAERLGGRAAALKKYQLRYLPGQERYLNSCNPKKCCDLIISNEDFSSAKILEND